MNPQLQHYQDKLVELVSRISRSDGSGLTKVPGVTTIRSTNQTCTRPAIYDPMLCLTVQGQKRLHVGDKVFSYNELSYLMVPIMMPVVGEIVQASEDKPFIGISVALDLRELSELLIDMGDSNKAPFKKCCSIDMYEADEDMLSAFKRIVALHENPHHIPVMLPLLKRELMYRILSGPGGNQLRQFLLFDSHANRVSKIIEMIRENYRAPLKIRELAEAVYMSESTLFSSFKSVTTMSPLQYQKHLRLNEARRIMIHEGLDASAAGYRVGYESPSQFSREYSRLFGAPPIADVSRVKLTQEHA